MNISDDLLCLYNAQIQERDGEYYIQVPREEVEVGEITTGDVHRVAVLSPRSKSNESSAPAHRQHNTEPPVEPGETLDVEIEDVGDQGDGIARVGPGYVLIVPGAEIGERISVEITEVRENMGFADIVERYDQ